MCGINGIIFKNSELDFNKIVQMNNMLHHRGPDLNGHMSFKNLLLGHTRLSIIDTSEKGSQPMSNDGRFWIIYNGEVYNYLELREELINKNYKFYTNTDTEVILCAYKEWGIKCFQKFNGEWSLSILDKQENKLIITRDGIGFKPCYIYEDTNYFAFSSEIKPFYALNEGLEYDLVNLGVSGETLSYNSKTIFHSDDHRSKWSKEQIKIWSNSLTYFLNELKDNDNQSITQLALRFCLSFNEISTIIPGMLNKSQVIENTQSSNLTPYSQEILDRIKKIYNTNSFFIK